MKIRILDVIFSVIGLIFLAPLFILISLMILLDSRGNIFYRQIRIGKNSLSFNLLKFRTMYANSDKKGLLTIGMKDSRITRVGYYLRKYKIDELPQLINVLKGEMSLVGPRPEVEKYVRLYSVEQGRILSIRPGITDYASIYYFNENVLLANSNNPEETYINEILPKKILLNIKYIENYNIHSYLEVIFLTLIKIFKKT